MAKQDAEAPEGMLQSHDDTSLTQLRPKFDGKEDGDYSNGHGVVA